MISIAMATYNGEKYLREQLDSILGQTIQDFELIVCDDCSTDSTVQILNEYAEKDSRIKVFVNEKNLGFRKNFERAIGLCKGEYIALSDQDDIWSTEHLELLRNNIRNKDLISGNSEFIDSMRRSLGDFYIPLEELKNISNNQSDYMVALCHRNLFQGCNVLFKRELLSYVLPIPLEAKYHDYWIAFIAATRGGVILLPEKTLEYRRHINSVSYKEKESIKKVFFDKNYRQKIKKDRDAHVLFLKAIQERVPDNNMVHGILLSAIRYHERLYSLSEWANVFYCIINFKRIYLSCSVVKFTKRLVKILLCC